MNMKETAHYMKNNWTTTTTIDSSLDMMSLFDYLGRAAGSELGKQVAGVAARRKIRTAIRQVSNKKYTGVVMLYPKSFLDWYFEDITDDVTVYKHNNKFSS